MLLSVVLAASGCSRIINWLESSQDDHFEWTEDVLLHNGEKVVAQRTAHLSGNSIAGGGGGSFNKGMKLGIISGSSEESSTWSDLYVPMLLDRDPKTGEWILVATFFHCDSWYKLGRPLLPYTEYRLTKSGAWIQQHLSAELVGRKANLFIADRKPPASHLTLQQKEKAVPPGAAKKFRWIVEKWEHISGCR